MSFSILPLELLDEVCDYLVSPDLARLSYTCASVHRAAQRQLYRHVAVSSSRHNLAVVLTLARKPALAHHVRSFSIDLDSHFTLLRPFYQQLACALSSMTELTSLRLFVDSGATWILEGISYPRLLHFASTFPLDSHISTFLSHTPALLELEVDSLPFRHDRPAYVLAPTSIPQLQQFVGSSRAAEAIIPSRPVYSVQLTAGDLTDAVVNRLAESATTVAVLSATTSSSPPSLLHLLSQRIQCLVHLRLMTTYSFHEAPDVNFYEDIAGALNAFPNLCTFELSGMHWGSHERNLDSESQRVWQNPLKSESEPNSDVLDIDPYSDLFFGY